MAPWVFSKEMDMFSCARRQGLAGHWRAAEVVAFGVGDAPLAGLLADDEEPLVFVGQGEEGVGSGGNV